ncbi:MAG: hypothetical protein Kapaf2KO_22760 [Candidatus Kapaibacteriales bacterium]
MRVKFLKELEEDVLGVLLSGSPKDYGVARDCGVTPELFLHGNNNRVFGIISELCEQQQIPSPEKIASILDGGEEYSNGTTLGRLYNLVDQHAVSETDFPSLCSNLVEFSSKEIIPDKLSQLARKLKEKPDWTQESVNTEINQILSGAGRTVQGRYNWEIARDYKKAIRQEALEGAAATTGLMDLDSRLKVRKGTLTVIGARPGQGKTALLTNIAIENSLKEKEVVIFSLEVSEIDMVQRQHSQLEEKPLSKIVEEHDRLDDDELVEMFKKAPIFIYDLNRPNFSTLSKAMKMLKSKNQIDVALIDYLGLMSHDKKNRWEGIGEISSNLKTLSKEVDIPIFLLVQLNRETEKNQDKEPTLANLRDSGSLEQDADNVLFIYEKPKDSKHHTKSNTFQSTRIKCAKQRRGSRFKIDVDFHMDIGKFKDHVENDRPSPIYQINSEEDLF